MDDVDTVATPDRSSACHVEAWRPPIDGIVEVFHAVIGDFHYPRHTHDAWTLLVVDRGVIAYDLDNRQRGATSGDVTLLPPGVSHDGGPGRWGASFRKRNLYLDADFLPSELVGVVVDGGHALSDLRPQIDSIHAAISTPAIDLVEIESRLALLRDQLATRLETGSGRGERFEPRLARDLREWLDGSLERQVRLSDASAELGRSVPHLIRTFTATYGLAPHEYLIGRRIETARRLLLDGLPPAKVATDLMFYDQSHLTRHFKRHTTTTPAAFARGRIVSS